MYATKLVKEIQLNNVAQYTEMLRNINKREMFDLKTFRKDKGLTQRELARSLGVDHSTISKAENHGVITEFLIECLCATYPELSGTIEPSDRKRGLDKPSLNDVSCATRINIVNIDTMEPTGEVVSIPSLPDGCIAFYNRTKTASVKRGDLVIARCIEMEVLPYGETVLSVTKSLRLLGELRRSGFANYVRLTAKDEVTELEQSQIEAMYVVVAVLRYLAF